MRKLFLAIGFLGVILLLVLCGMMIRNYFVFNIHCKDYLKLAADAPTVERAAGFLDKALEFIEAKQLIRGNSGFIITTSPTNDVEIWYQQLKSAQGVLRNVIEREGDGSSLEQIERDNALMKLREVLLDAGKSTGVTLPDYISLFPYQQLILFLLILSLLMQFSWLGLLSEYE